MDYSNKWGSYPPHYFVKVSLIIIFFVLINCLFGDDLDSLKINLQKEIHKKNLATFTQLKEISSIHKETETNKKNEILKKKILEQEQIIEKQTILDYSLKIGTLLLFLLVLYLIKILLESKKLLKDSRFKQQKLETDISELNTNKKQLQDLERKNQQFQIALNTYSQLELPLKDLKNNIDLLAVTKNEDDKKINRITSALGDLECIINKYKNASEIIVTEYTENNEMLEIK